MSTKLEIVQQVMDDLNLTSATALDRVKRHFDQRYRELLALPWLQISRRGEATQPVTVGSRYVTWPNCTKIYSIFDPGRDGMTLGELTFDELRNQQVMSDPPNNYAIARSSADTITVFLDVNPGSVYTLGADVEKKVVTLKDDDSPKFNESFHDILYYGVKNLELLKMEKGELAAQALGDPSIPGIGFYGRISDLKYHIAKTSYLNYQQGKDSNNYPAFVNTIVQ